MVTTDKFMPNGDNAITTRTCLMLDHSHISEEDHSHISEEFCCKTQNALDWNRCAHFQAYYFKWLIFFKALHYNSPYFKLIILGVLHILACDSRLFILGHFWSWMAPNPIKTSFSCLTLTRVDSMVHCRWNQFIQFLFIVELMVAGHIVHPLPFCPQFHPVVAGIVNTIGICLA